MTNAERVRLFCEQTDFLHLEAKDLKSRVPENSYVTSIIFSPEDVKSLASELEAISEYVKAVADDLQSE
ncbi:MAG: hypothetical protein WCB05_19365 [Candidatus Sulfotelmatobacter sp.]